MFFIFHVQEKWIWNITNNFIIIIKSDICIKLKYIRNVIDYNVWSINNISA